MTHDPGGNLLTIYSCDDVVNMVGNSTPGQRNKVCRVLVEDWGWDCSNCAYCSEKNLEPSPTVGFASLAFPFQSFIFGYFVRKIVEPLISKAIEKIEHDNGGIYWSFDFGINWVCDGTVRIQNVDISFESIDTSFVIQDENIILGIDMSDVKIKARIDVDMGWFDIDLLDWWYGICHALELIGTNVTANINSLSVGMTIPVDGSPMGDDDFDIHMGSIGLDFSGRNLPNLFEGVVDWLLDDI
jgi:hypothetical protein